MNRRLFLSGLFGTALFGTALFGKTASAELLTRGKYGSRQSYFDRVKKLTGKLAATDPASPQLRDIAVTLGAALQDFAFNEAGIREDKALPPIGGLQLITGNETEIPVPVQSTVLGPPRDLDDVPTLWFVDRVNQARDRAEEMVTLIDSQAALPHDYETAVADIVGLVDSINRPPE